MAKTRLEVMARLKSLIARAGHEATPEKEAVSAARLAYKLVLEHDLFPDEPEPEVRAAGPGAGYGRGVHHRPPRWQGYGVDPGVSSPFSPPVPPPVDDDLRVEAWRLTAVQAPPDSHGARLVHLYDGEVPSHGKATLCGARICKTPVWKAEWERGKAWGSWMPVYGRNSSRMLSEVAAAWPTTRGLCGPCVERASHRPDSDE